MTITPNRQIIYPDSDGKPMADNTLQFRWIVLFKENLECLFRDNSQVFVAGDLLWYPVAGHPEIRVAPDAMVVFKRPKAERGSYRQWEEDNVTPQVVFEILSPGNRWPEMFKKLKFYERYGVEEYYIYDPDGNELSGFLRENNELNEIQSINGWVSPRLGIRFELNAEELVVYYPNGERFKTTVELVEELVQSERQRVRTELQLAQIHQELEETEQQLTQSEQQRVQTEQQLEQTEQVLEQSEQQRVQTEQELLLERQRTERLAAYLRTQGIDPDGM